MTLDSLRVFALWKDLTACRELEGQKADVLSFRNKLSLLSSGVGCSCIAGCPDEVP
jgi:hypothetical protein